MWCPPPGWFTLPCKKTFRIPLVEVYAWTDSTIVLGLITGDPRRFKTYVGIHVCHIIDQIPPERWHHVNGVDNPADCASRGLYPFELLLNTLWWDSPEWLRRESTEWPKQFDRPQGSVPEEEREVCHIMITDSQEPLILTECYSSFVHLKRVTAWVFQFINNCCAKVKDNLTNQSPSLFVG